MSRGAILHLYLEGPRVPRSSLLLAPTTLGPLGNCVPGTVPPSARGLPVGLNPRPCRFKASQT